MDNFNARYEKELAYQEITSNKYTLYTILLYVLPLLFAGHYRKRSVLWYTYVLSVLMLFVSSILNYYYGIMDTNLLIAGTHQRKWYLDLIANGGSFTYNAHPVFIILIFACIPRSMILLVFTFMIQYIVTASLHDAARIAQLTYLKETDSLTRLFNKNKYNEMVSMYYPNVDNITVIFWDLNNLKIINDTYGHEYGDKSLSALASVLYAHSDEQCRRVYRFGGDEFVMIIDNPHDGEADRIISAVKDELVKCSYDISIEISSAVGVASGNGSDIIEIVKNADSAMYADKQLYHHR
uniref:GGDEF domain-containing protein n=1 Tax=Lachnospira eligens TaxID=39485 RepID=UPI0040276153